MASGQVTLTTQSVDYGGGRGHATLTNVIGWNVDANGNISFNLISSSDNVGGSWFICTSGATYYVELVPQVNYGSGWVNLDVKRQAITTVCCESGTCGQNTIQISTNLINQLGTYHLNSDCQLRFLYYMTVAPNPSPANPNAFPNSSYSEVSQVPVVVIMEYRPGSRKISGAWRSHNRSGGKCERKVGSWVEMKTQDGGTGTGNPPSRKAGGIWYNQRKEGLE